MKKKAVKDQIESLIGAGEESKEGPIGFSPRSKMVIELASEEARAMGHGYVGTEHLFLGLVREGEGIAAKVLTSLGVDLNKARQIVVKSLGEEMQNQEGGNFQAPKGKPKQQHSTENIDAFGRDLTAEAEKDKLDPVVGRTKEIERVIQVLK